MTHAPHMNAETRSLRMGFAATPEDCCWRLPLSVFRVAFPSALGFVGALAFALLTLSTGTSAVATAGMLVGDGGGAGCKNGTPRADGESLRWCSDGGTSGASGGGLAGASGCKPAGASKRAFDASSGSSSVRDPPCCEAVCSTSPIIASSRLTLQLRETRACLCTKISAELLGPTCVQIPPTCTHKIPNNRAIAPMHHSKSVRLGCPSSARPG